MSFGRRNQSKGRSTSLGQLIGALQGSYRERPQARNLLQTTPPVPEVLTLDLPTDQPIDGFLDEVDLHSAVTHTESELVHASPSGHDCTWGCLQV